MRGLKGSSDNSKSSSNDHSTGTTMGMSPSNTSSPFAGSAGGQSSSSSSSSTSASSSASSAASKATDVPVSAVIGPKIRVKGELVGEENLLIQGQVDGLIDLKDHTLTIGQQGTVKADVLAKTITIEGTVEGDLFGQERISILSSSNVKGNLVAERVILEDGAKFRGSIDMDLDTHKDKFENFSGTSSASASVPRSSSYRGNNTKPSDSKSKDTASS